MSSPDLTCVSCGFPLQQDGRTCTFCKADNLEIQVGLLHQKLKRVQGERDLAKLETSRVRMELQEEIDRLKDRVNDLLLLCEIEGRGTPSVPS